MNLRTQKRIYRYSRNDGGNMAAPASFSRINGFIDRIGAIETPFSIEMPDGNKRDVGEGEPQFRLALRTNRAVKALSTLDEANIAEAYL
ncbi:MAG: hypothetical protein O7H40_11920, partial [Gammaproteobacteria bacterium]|nr:hypothetical protein [Gammaproteobacteria bacterium]